MKKNKDNNNCEVPGCESSDIVIKYYGKQICRKHWNMDCNEKSRFTLKKALNIENNNKIKRIKEQEWFK